MNRGRSYVVLPQIRTERFERCFINRCLFNFISLSIVIQNVCFFGTNKELYIDVILFLKLLHDLIRVLIRRE